MNKPSSREIEQIKSHFKAVDLSLYEVLKEMDLKPLMPETDTSKYFQKLCREIIAQQLASKAARAIINRFMDLFPNKQITPTNILAVTEEDLRNVGMSWAKARYIRDLAQKTQAGEIEFATFLKLDDEKVIGELTKVKGIGRWTAEMFLIFTLGRGDVFSFGDLGLKRALRQLYDLNERDLTDEMEGIVQKWSPYRSYGCLALWNTID